MFALVNALKLNFSMKYLGKFRANMCGTCLIGIHWQTFMLP